jgi:hypothetical protein
VIEHAVVDGADEVVVSVCPDDHAGREMSAMRPRSLSPWV